MNKFLCFLLIFIYSISLSGQNSTPVIINEIGLMPESNSQYVELLVLGNNQGGVSPVNLEGWVLDNLSAAHAQDTVYLSFGDCFSSIPPGTLILIYDDYLPPSGISTQNNGTPNNDGVYQLPISHPCLQKWVTTGFGNSFKTQSSALNWGKILPLSQSSDVVQLRDNAQQLRFAVS